MVLDPEQLEGDALLLQFGVPGRPVGHRAIPGCGPVWCEQPRLDRRRVHLLWHGPRQPRAADPAEVVVHGALGEPKGPRDLALAPALVEREAEGLEHLAHGKSLCWHRLAPDGSPGGVAPAVSVRAPRQPLIGFTRNR